MDLIHPEPMPNPINDIPLIPIIETVSAKSTLIIPCLIIMSFIHFIALYRVSSANLKASTIEVFLFTIFISLLLGIIIKVSKK